jgi:hypothetical protein
MSDDAGMTLTEALGVESVATIILPDERMVIVHRCIGCGELTLGIVDGLDLTSYEVPNETTLRWMLQELALPETGWRPSPRLAEGFASDAHCQPDMMPH